VALEFLSFMTSGRQVSALPTMKLGFQEQKEVQSIQSQLTEFLPAQEARELAVQIYDLALDADEEINRLRQDP
jgi:hypothetical protein